MPKKIVLSDQAAAFLRANHDKLPYTELAKKLSMCPDTVKRFIVRLGLREIEGAKYVVARSVETEKWRRPCMKCGDDKPRPKWLYFCSSCRSDLETSALDL